MPNPSPADPTLTLTTSELLAFLDGSGLSAIHGVPLDFDALRADDNAPLRIRAGYRSLVARGLAHTLDADPTSAGGQGGVTFGLELRALVGTAALPERTLMLSHSRGDEPTATLHLLSGPRLTVACQGGDPDLWLFRALPTAADERAEIDAFLRGLCPLDHTPALEARLPVADFARAALAVRSGSLAEAADILLAAGCDPAVAADFVADLERRSAWSCLSAANLRRQDPVRLHALTIVNAATHCWLVQQNEEGDSVTLAAASAAACRAAVHALAALRPEPSPA